MPALTEQLTLDSSSRALVIACVDFGVILGFVSHRELRMFFRDRLVRGLIAFVSIALASTGGLAPLAEAAERADSRQTFRTVTVEDLEGMRTALLEYLRGSSLGDRNELVRLTENSKVAIDSSDSKRIGLWRLSAEPKGMFLQLRAGGDESVTVNYRATVERVNEEWLVTGIKSQFIHGRR